MIQVLWEGNEVIARSLHAEGLLQIHLKAPAGWKEAQRAALVSLLAREIEEVRIGCKCSFGAAAEVVDWDWASGRMRIRLARRRVAGRPGPNAPPPLEEDVRVLLEGKADELRFLLEAMIQIQTDAPPGLIHRTLFKISPVAPLGWEFEIGQQCCVRFARAGERAGERLVVSMGLTHGPTGWEPFLRIARLDELGILRGETRLQGRPLGASPRDWLAEACELAPLLARGFRRGEVEWNLETSGLTPRLRFGERTLLPSLRALADRIRAGGMYGGM
jgi:hypothetical protein